MHTESFTPYELCGKDASGKPLPCSQLTSTGSHTVTVTAFSSSGGTGTNLGSYTLKFTIGSGSGAALTGLSLIASASGQAISGYNPIAGGATINLSSLSTQDLSIQANASSSASIGSVLFSLDGGSYTHGESVAPYVLCGDGVACAQLKTAGSHSLTATAYSAAGESGSVVGSVSLSFTIQTSAPAPSPSPAPAPGGPIAGLALVNAGNAQPISGFNPIANGATINLSSLPTSALSIFATPAASASIGSVLFSLDAGSYTHVEGGAPYSLCGDAATSATACPQLTVTGNHSLTATAYSGAAQTGSVLGSLTISFAVQGSAPAPSGSTTLLSYIKTLGPGGGGYLSGSTLTPWSKTPLDAMTPRREQYSQALRSARPGRQGFI